MLERIKDFIADLDLLQVLSTLGVVVLCTLVGSGLLYVLLAIVGGVRYVR